MRQVTFQRLVCALLLAGAVASWLPFGRDMQARAEWVDRLLRLSDRATDEALRAVYVRALERVPPDTRAYVEAIAGLAVSRPAWFGVEAFTPEALDLIEQHMGAVPPARADDPAFVPAPASPPPVRMTATGGLLAGERFRLPARAGVLMASAAPALARPLARLVGRALSPRAP